MTRIIGITGSVGAGKSSLTSHLVTRGYDVWDADQAAHDLIERQDAELCAAIMEIYPGAFRDGRLTREGLASQINKHEDFDSLDEVFFPRLMKIARAYISAMRKGEASRNMVFLDVPLLFETGMNRLCDLTITVFAFEATRRARVERRSGWSPEKFDLIAGRQFDDAEKIKRADLVFNNNIPQEIFAERVRHLLDRLETVPDLIEGEATIKELQGMIGETIALMQDYNVRALDRMLREPPDPRWEVHLGRIRQTSSMKTLLTEWHPAVQKLRAYLERTRDEKKVSEILQGLE